MSSLTNKLILERHEKLLIIKFNNPKSKNAWRTEEYERIPQILNNARNDDTITVVALTGVGDFYSSGTDLSNSPALNDGTDLDEFFVKRKEIINTFVKAFIDFPKLLVAVVNGPCFGIAATTAALCDVIYCTDKAYFQTPFTKLGLCAEGCSSYTFPRILGTSKASEMLMLNYKLSSEEALRYKFVSEIFQYDEIESIVWPRLVEWSNMASGSIQTTKQLIRKFDKASLLEACIAETDALYKRWYSEEFFNAIATYMALKKKSKL